LSFQSQHNNAPRMFSAIEDDWPRRLTGLLREERKSTMSTRREFMRNTLIGGSGLALFGGFASERAWGFYQTMPHSTPLWRTLFRGVGPGGIPVAAPDPFAAPVTGVAHYTLGINQFIDQLHPTLGPTALWG